MLKGGEDDTAHLIDTEPVLLFGCNSTEIITIGVAGFVVSGFASAILLAPFGKWYFAIPFGLLTALAAIIVGGRRLGKAKEGKPDGYYNRYLNARLSKLGIKKGAFVTRTGYWRIRR